MISYQVSRTDRQFFKRFELTVVSTAVRVVLIVTLLYQTLYSICITLTRFEHQISNRFSLPFLVNELNKALKRKDTLL
jgi:hypothetical protein